MKFGVREICDVVFKAKTAGSIGSYKYVAGQPVLYIDSAKTSTLEGTGTSVYATGGRGNARLIAWEGEKTLTFTVEDALLSPIGFAILSGAGLFKAGENGHVVHSHVTCNTVVGADGVINLEDALADTEAIDEGAPIFVMTVSGGSFESLVEGVTVSGKTLTGATAHAGKQVYVDFYVQKTSKATELTIDMENFAGYYYVEAQTLFRQQENGKDLPADLIFPNVKVQSNFTFSMAATGDPSTFTFTMDALPGYTRFDRSKKVLCAIQILEDVEGETVAGEDSAGLIADDTKEYPIVAGE